MQQTAGITVACTVLVPALIHDAGARAWWPVRLRADVRSMNARPDDSIASAEVA